MPRKGVPWFCPKCSAPLRFEAREVNGTPALYVHCDGDGCGYSSRSRAQRAAQEARRILEAVRIAQGTEGKI